MAGDVRLEPMTEEEFQAFLLEQVEEYAREKERAGVWRPGESLARSRSELGWLLSGDHAGHRFLALRDREGQRTASVWIGPPPEGDEAGVAYLYQVTVDPARRGEGLGRRALDALVDLLRAEGAREVRLNVFRANARAHALYRRLGFEETEGDAVAARMRRRLTRRTPSHRD